MEKKSSLSVSQKRYLAVDIGASSGRHIVASLENGKLMMREVYRFKNGVTEKDGRLYWDADRLFGEILRGLKAADEAGLRPDYVGIDTWAVDYALLTEKDEPIGGVFAYRDGRGAAVKEATHAVTDFPTLYRKTGIQYAPFNTLYQLFDDKRTGRLDRAHSFLMLPDYFHFRLTGVKKQEYTNATSTGMVNALTHRWDEEIVEKHGFPKYLFGELSQPGTVVGHFTPAIRKAVGYDATVILPATHDTASAVLAAPVTDGAPYLSSGTWSLLGAEVPAAHTEERAMQYNYSNEGSVNYAFRCQKNIIGLWMIQEVRKELGEKYSFAELAEMARKEPNDDLLDLSDSRYLAPKSMIGEIQAAVGKRSVGALAYTVFRSLARSYKTALEELEAVIGKGSDTLHVIGGGCQNALLNELTARETGKKITVGPVEATAIGNLIAQMIGTGEIASLREAREIVKTSFDITEVN
ncbi:MAG: rhamnulokinase [Clostridia bacterium]|nr:rhamnulokinase [Clostridia bacterium]